VTFQLCTNRDISTWLQQGVEGSMNRTMKSIRSLELTSIRRGDRIII
jgi:hypothetical protein